MYHVISTSRKKSNPRTGSETCARPLQTFPPSLSRPTIVTSFRGVRWSSENRLIPAAQYTHAIYQTITRSRRPSVCQYTARSEHGRGLDRCWVAYARARFPRAAYLSKSSFWLFFVRTVWREACAASRRELLACVSVVPFMRVRGETFFGLGRISPT